MKKVIYEIKIGNAVGTKQDIVNALIALANQIANAPIEDVDGACFNDMTINDVQVTKLNQ